MKVFVYGSLMKHLGNHPVIAGEEFLCSGVTQRNFKMVSFGWYPGVLKDENGSPVIGELYDVSEETMSHLDRLEGNGRFYQRELVDIDPIGTVNQTPEKTGKAWMYVLMENTLNCKDVSSCDWRSHLANESLREEMKNRAV